MQRTPKMIVSHNQLPLGLSLPSVRLVSDQHGSPSFAQGDFRSGVQLAVLLTKTGMLPMTVYPGILGTVTNTH